MSSHSGRKNKLVDIQRRITSLRGRAEDVKGTIAKLVTDLNYLQSSNAAYIADVRAMTDTDPDTIVLKSDLEKTIVEFLYDLKPKAIDARDYVDAIDFVNQTIWDEP